MFTFEDLQAMQYTYFVPYSKHNLKSGRINYDPMQQYFTVLSKEGKSMELQSNNTGHCWKLVYEYGGYTFYHKHHIEEEYHYQTDLGTLYDTILYIVGHDEYQMRNRNTISVDEEKRSNSYFWRLIDTYGIVA